MMGMIFLNTRLYFMTLFDTFMIQIFYKANKKSDIQLNELKLGKDRLLHMDRFTES